jgi:hypothetical protein
MQRIGIAGRCLNVTHRLSAGNDGAFLRGLFDFLFLVKGAAEIVDAHHEYHQKRKNDGELQQRRTACFSD